MNDMRKTLVLILLVILALSSACSAETITYRELSADSESEFLKVSLQLPVKWQNFYDFLAKFPNLKEVDMFDTPVNPKQAHELHELFPNVEFGMTIRFAEHHLRTDDTAFSTLHDNAAWHNIYDLSVVKYCKNLYALDIGHNSFKDLSFLYEMPQLRVLIVACGDAKDITPIGSLKHLEYLEIFHNNIEDISCLRDLPHLMDLNIVNNLITDLEPLKEIKSLQRLWIFRHYRGRENEDPAFLDELQKALPNCHIDWTHTSTAGGWRKDPHYDVIYRVFHSRKYEPFADSLPENIPEGFAPRSDPE